MSAMPDSYYEGLGYTKAANFCSDIHLSESCPPARKCDNWIDYQLNNFFDQVVNTSENLFIAGDLFHKWNNSLLFTNKVMSLMRGISTGRGKYYAIPGQHDLEHHNIDSIPKTSFGTLLQAEAMTDGLVMNGTMSDFPVWVKGFGWGQELHGLTKGDYIKVAYIHKYVWKEGHGYTGATEGHVDQIRKELKGFDLVFCGDNHSAFVDESAFPIIVNCGCLFRRRSDEKDYKPAFYSLWTKDLEFRVQINYMNCEEDEWVEESRTVGESEDIDLTEFRKAMIVNNEINIKLKETILNYCRNNGVSRDVEKGIVSIIDEVERRHE